MSRRRPSSVRRWMRARRRRSHHSTCFGRELGREAARAARRPRPPRGASAESTSALGRGRAAPRARPRWSGPRGRAARGRSRRSAPSRSDHAGARRAGGSATSGSKRPSGQMAAASERRSAATQKHAARRRRRRAARPRRDQLVEPARPSARRRSALGQRAQVEEEIVQLVGVAQVGPRLVDHRGDGLGVEPPDVVGHLGGQAAAQRDRARAALLERGVVEEGVGIGVQDLVGEARTAPASRAPRARISPACRAPERCARGPRRPSPR